MPCGRFGGGGGGACAPFAPPLGPALIRKILKSILVLDRKI